MTHHQHSHRRKDNCVTISEIINDDCTSLCVPTTSGESLESILNKLCAIPETDPVFNTWLSTFGLDQEGNVLMSDGNTYIWVDPTTITGDIEISGAPNNCLEERDDGLYVPCSNTIYIVENGITEDPLGTFILGGVLTQETTFTQTSFGMNFNYDGTNFAIHANNSASGGGVWGQTTNGYGIYGSATSGRAVTGVATSGIAGVFQNTDATNPALFAVNEGGGPVATFGLLQDGSDPVASILGTGQLILNKYGLSTFLDTPITLLGALADGSIIEVDPGSLAGSSFTVDNGLELSTATNGQLGGDLLHTTQINSEGFVLLVTGSVNATGSFQVVNTDNTNVIAAIAGTAPGSFGTGVYGNGLSRGVNGVSTSGVGGVFTATNGTGLIASATTGLPLNVQGTAVSQSTVTSVANFAKYASAGAGQNGIGISTDFYVEDDSGTANQTYSIISKWTTAANLSRESTYEHWGYSTAMGGLVKNMQLTGLGDMTVYPHANFAGYTSSTGAYGAILTGGTIGVEANSPILPIFAENTSAAGANVKDFLVTRRVGIGVNGMGVKIRADLANDAGSQQFASEIQTVWSDAAALTERSQFNFVLNDAIGGFNTKAVLTGDGIFGVGVNAPVTGTRVEVIDNSLGAKSMVHLSSTSTAAASNLQKILNISLSGANATASQATYGAYVLNSHTGTTPLSYGVYADGVTYGLYGNSDAGVGTTGVSNSNVGVYGISTSNNGVSAQSSSGNAISAVSLTGTCATFTVVPATTATVVPVTKFSRSSSGTAANGIGVSLDMFVQNITGGTNLSNSIISKWTDATFATRVSELGISGVNAGATTSLLTIDGTGIFTLVQGLQDFANDAGAAGGGIPVNGLYRNGSVVQIRVV